MPKRTVYFIANYGMDGRAPRSLVFASFDREECEKRHNKSKDKQYNGVGLQVVDVEDVVEQAIEKLTPLEYLVYSHSRGRTGDQTYYSVTENGKEIQASFSMDEIKPYLERFKRHHDMVVNDVVIEIEKVRKTARNKLGVIAVMLLDKAI